MKRIALINPPFREVKHRMKDAYPLGLGYIKAFCNSKGIDCDLYDFSCSRLSDYDLIEKYNLHSYDLIGISSYSLFFNDTVRLINLLKNSHNTIIVGGHHATLCGAKILQDFPNIDFCLKGFGEKSFYEFVNFWGTEDIYSVPGLCYRKGMGFFENPIIYEGLDINEFVSPVRDDIIIDGDNYEFDVTNKVFHISTSRGCPYHCTYCVNCKNNYWLVRSESSILDELKQEFYGKNYKYINFVDCNFYVNPSRAERIIEKIRSVYPGVKFSFQTRSDQICNNKERLKKLLSVGDCSVTLGIESNSSRVLKRYHKETTPQINQDAINFLKQTPSQTLVYMIMFEALESLDDIRESFDFLKDNNLLDYATVGNIYQTLVPFYGSQYYDEYHNYYIGSIHERTTPVFVDHKVKKLYDAVYEFRNLYEDRISEAVFILSGLTKTIDEKKELLFLLKIQYVVFEFLLVVCENFGFCDVGLLQEAGFTKELDKILGKMEKFANEKNHVC